MILAHWTYTREEWRHFHRWRMRQKSWLHYIWHRLKPGLQRKTAEIRITPGSVWTNERNEPFHEGSRHFQRVSIRDAGKLNVMEICYDHDSNSREIRIPIPKGKLREAIEVQEKLIAR
jgi:hypothetical protein